MTTIKSTFLFIAFLSLSLMSCGQKQQKESTSEVSDAVISLISPDQLNKMETETLIIDVRTPEEYAAGHLENAINIDYRSGNFKDQLDQLDRTQKVTVYCKVGGRSGRSAKVLKEMGFEKVYDLDGGILEWEKGGFKTVK